MAILLGVASVNIGVDVQGIYHQGPVGFIGEYVRRLRSSPYGLRGTKSERALKLELGRSVAADCYVLGSSHEMGIGLDRMPALKARCESLINLGVSAATFQDVVMLLAKLPGNAPTKAIIGIDPWLFKANAGEVWTQFSSQYQDARRLFDLDRQSAFFSIPAKWTNIISADYFLRNVKDILFNAGRGASVPILEASATDDAFSDDDETVRPDGSLTYSRRYLANVRISDQVECTDYKIVRPFIETESVAEFKKLLQRLRDLRVEPIFLLMPYHPGVLSCANATALALKEVEAFVTTIAQQQKVTLFGSYDPKRFDLTSKDFYDFMHVNHDALKKIN